MQCNAGRVTGVSRAGCNWYQEKAREKQYSVRVEYSRGGVGVEGWLRGKRRSRVGSIPWRPSPPPPSPPDLLYCVSSSLHFNITTHIHCSVQCKWELYLVCILGGDQWCPCQSCRLPSIVGVGTRCDKGSWQSYLFWINVRICRPRRSIVGGANVTREAILSSNTNAQLSANNSLWLNTKKVGIVFIETT